MNTAVIESMRYPFWTAAVSGFLFGKMAATSGASGLAAGVLPAVQLAVEYLPSEIINSCIDNMTLYILAGAVNTACSTVLVYGGAALLGLVTTPAVLAAGITFGTLRTITLLEAAILSKSPHRDLTHVLTSAAKVTLIAAGTFTVISLGIVSLPTGLALGGILSAFATYDFLQASSTFNKSLRESGV